MNLGGRLAFSALLCPGGVHLVSYVRSPAGLRVQRYSRLLRRLDEEHAGRLLAELLEAEGARGQRVSLAVSGFGTCHQILTLPPASHEILQPVVMRELRRFFPDLFTAGGPDPFVEFVEVAPSGVDGTPQKDLLVGAVPHVVLHAVTEALSARGIQLDHWTILPQALQRLFEAFNSPQETTAALIMVPDWPLVGFFHDGDLRLFSEPRSTPATGNAPDLEAVIPHVERGSIFLRQQFPGAVLDRLFVAAGGEPSLVGAEEYLAERLSMPVASLGPVDMAPGALAAFGAALDAAAPDGLNLLPEALRPPSFSEQWTRRLALAAVAILLAASAWWAWSARTSEIAARDLLEETSARVASRRSEIAGVQEVIDARQAHTQRSILIEVLAQDARRLPEILWPLQDAAPQVSVRSLNLARQPEGWSVSISAEATAWTYPEASSAIARLVEQLGAELPPDALTIGAIQLDRANPPDSLGLDLGSPAIAARTEMSFIVPVAKELAE